MSCIVQDTRYSSSLCERLFDHETCLNKTVSYALIIFSRINLAFFISYFYCTWPNFIWKMTLGNTLSSLFLLKLFRHLGKNGGFKYQ